jgi:hypothetical protein
MPATYEPIATTTLGSATSTITFSSIPATYTDLRLVFVFSGNASVNPRFRFNGDTGSNYSQTALMGDGSSAQSTRGTSQTLIYTTIYNGLASGVPGLCTIDVFSYTGSTFKTALLTGSTDSNGSGQVERDVALWRSTSAITQIDLISGSSTFNVGTTATLYGIKNA